MGTTVVVAALAARLVAAEVVVAGSGMPGGAAAQATMHDFVRRPLAETQAAPAQRGWGASRAAGCSGGGDDGAPDLYVDGMRLRRDRIGHWVFPRSDKYPCVYT